MGKEISMKKVVGLWIDDKKAVIFSLADEGTGIKRITSESNKSVRFSGGVQKEAVVDDGDKRSNSHLNSYYDEVLSYIRDAESILIFGPGEAKHEIKKRLQNVELHGHIVGIETVEKMTDNQIVTKIRQRFLK
jgi:stalled ribosome rescue protein Dom34